MNRAVQVDRMGGIEVLTLREVPVPTAGPNQVLVRTIASSLNPIDRKMRTRKGLTFPLTFGWDVAGVVVESNVSEYKAGDRVIALTSPLANGVGAWTDLVALDADQLAHAPTSLSLSDAAPIPLAGMTAVQAWNKLVLSPGDRVLVTGAAGAIGSLIVQLARNAGVHIDGLVSRPQHVNHVRSLGAGLVTKDRTALPAKRYDAIVDTVGLPARGVDVTELLTENGQFVTTIKESQVPGGQLVLIAIEQEGLTQLVKMVDEGSLTVRVAARYPLHEIHAAHEHVEAGGLLGKVVLDF
jgi:NADPH:quinone reductase-like Zn-dependent oxidoreductase